VQHLPVLWLNWCRWLGYVISLYFLLAYDQRNWKFCDKHYRGITATCLTHFQWSSNTTELFLKIRLVLTYVTVGSTDLGISPGHNCSLSSCCEVFFLTVIYNFAVTHAKNHMMKSDGRTENLHCWMSLIWLHHKQQCYNKFTLCWTLNVTVLTASQNSNVINVQHLLILWLTGSDCLDTSFQQILLAYEQGNLSFYDKHYRGITAACLTYFQWSSNTTELFLKITSGYATWFTAGDAIRIAHYDVIVDVITQKL